MPDNPATAQLFYYRHDVIQGLTGYEAICFLFHEF